VKEDNKSRSGTNKRLVLLAGALAISLTLFVVAIFAVGGAGEVMRMLGITQDPVAVQPGPEVPGIPDPDVAQQPPGDPTVTPGVETTPSVDATPVSDPQEVPPTQEAPPSVTAAAFPVGSAQAAMYREQLQSQTQIGRLADNKIRSIAIGTAVTAGNRSQIPLTVTYRAGGSVSGTMQLASQEGLWYFLSITAAGGRDMGPRPRTVDSGVVNTIATQQGTAANQRLIREGLLQGGFRTARVDGVSKGAGSATVNVTLLGGTLDRQAARFVLISKEDSGRKYWFITRFELK